MGKIGKPQKRKKNKIKNYGWYKNNKTVNQAPKTNEQEVPKRLRELGMAIKELQSGKRSRNKFKNKPDGPNPDSVNLPPSKKMKKNNRMKKIAAPVDQPGEKKMGKKMKRLTQEATETYIDNLKATRPLLENFKFKQKAKETDKQFLRRVERESQHSITQSKIADHYDISDTDKVKSIIKEKLIAQKRKKKQQLHDEEETELTDPKVDEKKKIIKEFLHDDVAFGDVVHAPPVLSVLPKKATSHGFDRPGLRMPELKEAFSNKNPNVLLKDSIVQRKKGETVKRKNLTVHQQFESDVKREKFVEAYRQMKKKRKLN